MSESKSSNARIRWTCWLAVLVAILSLSWLKVDENQRDRDQQRSWRIGIRKAQAVNQLEAEELVGWLRDLNTQANSRQKVRDGLNDGKPFEVKEVNHLEIAMWKDPQSDIALELKFDGELLVGHVINFRTGPLLQSFPQPEQFSYHSWLEVLRESVISSAIALWFIAFSVAILVRKWGRIACEVMVLTSLAAGAAWLVSPIYSLTVRGVFSNDNLFYALMMYMVSLGMLAYYVPRSDLSPRFSLRGLLAITTAFAVLLALGPLGYIAMAYFVFGVVAFLLTQRWGDYETELLVPRSNE